MKSLLIAIALVLGLTVVASVAMPTVARACTIEVDC